MSTQELRELDAWIEINLFGRVDVKVEGSTFGEISWDSDKMPVRQFSTDPAAAMQVLEKCCEKLDAPDKYNPGVSPIVKSVGRFWVGNQNGQTLPLAICLFAKQLFTKEGK